MRQALFGGGNGGFLNNRPAVLSGKNPMVGLGGNGEGLGTGAASHLAFWGKACRCTKVFEAASDAMKGHPCPGEDLVQTSRRPTRMMCAKKGRPGKARRSTPM